MYLILFNPLSKSGKNKKVINKAKKIIKVQNETYTEMSIISIGDIEEFIKNTSNDVKILVVGGDGTVHYVLNYLHGKEVANEVYFYGAGTGNDFNRNAKNDGPFISLNRYFKNLPSIEFEGINRNFVNGCGLGLDAYVCECVRKGNGKNPIEYKLQTVKAFLTSKKFSLELIVDGVSEKHENVWLISVMSGPYQGGGMKFAPEADIEDEWLYICMVNNYSRLKVLSLFPKIFKGKHTKYVYMKRCKEVIIKTDSKIYLQTDGEVVSNINEVKIKR